MTLADYMAECLMHPKYGYYQNERIFGKGGDFITAPEISQMFGEIIGLYIADRWYKMGKPSSFHLIEYGPGRGTLMEDILRATAAVEGLHSSANIHFIEASQQLKDLQKQKVPIAHWHDSLASVPDGPTIIVGNEFFDALPIHQFEKQNGSWLERCIHTDGEELQVVLTQPSGQVALIPSHMKNGPDGSVAEVCPAALAVTGDIASRLKEHTGSALFLDYGYMKSTYGDTFQALKAHKFTDPLSDPGSADLTAHVAFDQIALCAKQLSCNTYGPSTQGGFLMALGIGERAQQLASLVSQDDQQRLLTELKRLTSPDEMGTLFKVLAIQNEELAPPPGF